MSDESAVQLDTATFAMTAPNVTLRVNRRLKPNHPAYQLIGQVVAEWAHLEHTLDIIIWEMAGVHQTIGSCITGQLSGHYPRFNAIQTLAKARGLSEAMQAEIEQLGNRVSGVAKERHRIAHDAWLYEDLTEAWGQYRSVLPKSVESKMAKSERPNKAGVENITKDQLELAFEKTKEKVKEIGLMRLKLMDQLEKLKIKKP